MPTVSKQKLAIAAIEKIEDKIYVVRGQRVMLDSDLAAVYEVETRVLKQAVRRNRTGFQSISCSSFRIKRSRI